MENYIISKIHNEMKKKKIGRHNEKRKGKK